MEGKAETAAAATVEQYRVTKRYRGGKEGERDGWDRFNRQQSLLSIAVSRGISIRRLSTAVLPCLTQLGFSGLLPVHNSLLQLGH